MISSETVYGPLARIVAGWMMILTAQCCHRACAFAHLIASINIGFGNPLLECMHQAQGCEDYSDLGQPIAINPRP